MARSQGALLLLHAIYVLSTTLTVLAKGTTTPTTTFINATVVRIPNGSTSPVYLTSGNTFVYKLPPDPFSKLRDVEGNSVDGMQPVPGWIYFDNGTLTVGGSPYSPRRPKTRQPASSIRLYFSGYNSTNHLHTLDFLVILDDNIPPLPSNTSVQGNRTNGITYEAVTGQPVPPAFINVPYRFTLPHGIIVDADGDTLIYTADMTAADAQTQPWLVFDNSTLTFSGTPQAITPLDVILTATDPQGAEAMIRFHVDVELPPSSTSSTSPTPAAVGVQDTGGGFAPAIHVAEILLPVFGAVLVLVSCFVLLVRKRRVTKEPGDEERGDKDGDKAGQEEGGIAVEAEVAEEGGEEKVAPVQGEEAKLVNKEVNYDDVDDVPLALVKSNLDKTRGIEMDDVPLALVKSNLDKARGIEPLSPLAHLITSPVTGIHSTTEPPTFIINRPPIIPFTPLSALVRPPSVHSVLTSADTLRELYTLYMDCMEKRVSMTSSVGESVWSRRADLVRLRYPELFEGDNPAFAHRDFGKGRRVRAATEDMVFTAAVAGPKPEPMAGNSGWGRVHHAALLPPLPRRDGSRRMGRSQSEGLGPPPSSPHALIALRDKKPGYPPSLDSDRKRHHHRARTNTDDTTNTTASSSTTLIPEKERKTPPITIPSVHRVTARAGDSFRYRIPLPVPLPTDKIPPPYRATQQNGTPLPTWMRFNPTTFSLWGCPFHTDCGAVIVHVVREAGEGVPDVVVWKGLVTVVSGEGGGSA
ncbi:hypothetical protein HK104_002577 [Borealophlyctis nickersoniae]|nr:hypothetical protein HK104_002577 [Borealophlyctis nickersoniae]